MNSKINVDKIQKDAEDYYRRGEFFCSEAIVASIRENLIPEMPEEMIAAASGFPVGVGRAKCMCGAISGGVICAGYAFGRVMPGDKDRSEKTLAVANEIQTNFKNRHRVACCSILTRGMDMGSGEHKEQCISFTGEIARDTAEIIARECHLEVEGE